ncbi:MAG TPA: CDP-diacylglycerol--serine O-phosphatidyltransferase [Candidatus Acidoferrales bacterium]|nr:CDP-diacylglycerol--serine O-phosphatidyltransferase [Candidatus Acidoferrales bacterium]
MTAGAMFPHTGKGSRLRRGVYLLPSLFTVGNLLCGYYAILMTLQGTSLDFDNAAKAIGLAILFDSLDGRVARLIGGDSEFGKQFDSLADVISFGVAPALLAFVWGLHGLSESDPLAKHVLLMGWICTLGFVLCCAWRLARFNIQGMLPGSSNRYFVGMPTPGAAAMVAAMVHAKKFPLDDMRLGAAWLALVAILAVLMVSKLRFYGFKDLKWNVRQPPLLVVLLALIIVLALFYSEQVLLIAATGYTLSGPLVWLYRAVHLRASARSLETPASR